MPRGRRNGEYPLPAGWDVGRDFDGKIYFIDHHNKKTTWIDPRDRFTKPQTFADCVGNELPLGWEETYDPQIGLYYINHIDQSNQIEDPRQQWRQLQEAMLKEYLVTAQEDLAAKREIYDIKQQRLSLAQDEYQHLNNALVNLNTSRSSLCSTSSSSSIKYDPDLLKAEVALSRDRVMRLRHELLQIRAEVQYTEMGVENLAQVDRKLSGHGGVYNVAEAQAIMNELRNIQKSLSSGEREKAELVQSLARLKDDLTRLQSSGSSPDVSTLNIPMERLSTASQTDLSGELAPIGARLAEMARMRLQYDESRKKVQEIQQQLADLEDRVTPGQTESDKDRLLLIQEKEQLLRELRSMNSKGRSEGEMDLVHSEIKKLEQDLNSALEMSNRAIANRLKIHEQKQFLLQQLKDAMCLTTCLESKLKSLSASTLSMSSSSSLGSLSTTSSKGSLSSLSFTDIYGVPQCAQDAFNLQDLHKRVAQLIQGTCPPPPPEVATASVVVPPSSGGVQVMTGGGGPSLSPRSSLSSVSPPISPYDYGPPPSYEQAYVGSERQRAGELMGDACQALAFRNHMMYVGRPVPPNIHLPVGEGGAAASGPGRPRSVYDSGSDSNPPLSPISESAPDCELALLQKTSSCSVSGSNTRSVSAAVSDESVAGDSGVFEACHHRRATTNHDDLVATTAAAVDLETAQVQIKLRYAAADCLLHVGLERVRNLGALAVADDCQVCIKASLLPCSAASVVTCCTAFVPNGLRPTFGETFRIAIPLSKLYTKTLQVTVWSLADDREDCVGCAQVSLADYNPDTVSNKWYNVLSFRFLQPHGGGIISSQNAEAKAPVGSDCQMSYGARSSSDIGLYSGGSHPMFPSVKEESSDESTIISSQTSTLTRSQGPEMFGMDLRHADVHGGEGVDSEEEEDDDDEESEGDDYEGRAYDDPCEEVYNERLDATVLAAVDFLDGEVETCDKETNTECVFIPEKGGKKSGGGVSGVGGSSGGVEVTQAPVIKRSQTFSPSAAVSKNQYICRLNRSDSDSSMPLYRRGPFQRNSIERRSLRWKNKPTVLKQPVAGVGRGLARPGRTSIDLELDLRAQHTKLVTLNDEIQRLKDLKRRLEEAVVKGETELPAWLNENEQLRQMLSSTTRESLKQSSEDKKIEKLIKKTAWEIYKLRKSRKQQPDINTFREKMAFFTRANVNVPPLLLPPDSEDDNDQHNSTLKAAASLPNGDEDHTVTSATAAAGGDERFTYVVDRELGVEV